MKAEQIQVPICYERSFRRIGALDSDLTEALPASRRPALPLRSSMMIKQQQDSPVLATTGAAPETLSPVGDRKVVTSPSFPRVLGPYSHAVVAGGFVFVAGQAPINSAIQEFELGDIRSETQLELTNMSAILESSGSDMVHVVKVSIHLANLDD